MGKYVKQEPTTMRLKGFWRDRKGNGQRFWYKLCDYRWQLYYAWKRAWNGYDDVDIFSLDERLCERLIAQLTEFVDDHSKIIDAPEVDAAAVKIIDLLDYMLDDERAGRELFPDAPTKECDFMGEHFEVIDYTREQYMEMAEYAHKKLVEAFTLLGENMGRWWI